MEDPLGGRDLGLQLYRLLRDICQLIHVARALN